MRWGDLGVVIGLLLGAPSRVTRSAGELYQRFVAAVARIAKNRPDIDDVAIDLTGSDALEGGWGYTVSAGDVCQLFDRLDQISRTGRCNGPQAGWARKLGFLIRIILEMPDEILRALNIPTEWRTIEEVSSTGEEYAGAWNCEVTWGEFAQVIRSLDDAAFGRFDPTAPQAFWAYQLVETILVASRLEPPQEEPGAVDWEGKRPEDLGETIYGQMYDELLQMAMEAFKGHPDQVAQAERAVEEYLTKSHAKPKWRLDRSIAASSFEWSRTMRGLIDWANERHIRLPNEALINMTHDILGAEGHSRRPAMLVRAMALRGQYGEVQHLGS